MDRSDRTEGLVQRRTGATSGARQNNSEENGAVGTSATAAYDHDADSKETRLTLMEEVLLLGLKDKEVGDCSLDR